MTVNIIDKEKEPVTLNEIYQIWQKLKSRYMDAIVILRQENNYYSFEEDARTISGIMKVERETSWKDKRISILPYHQTDILLRKMVKAGYRIAMCEPVFFSLYQ